MIPQSTPWVIGLQLQNNTPIIFSLFYYAFTARAPPSPRLSSGTSPHSMEPLIGLWAFRKNFREIAFSRTLRPYLAIMRRRIGAWKNSDIRATPPFSRLFWGSIPLWGMWATRHSQVGIIPSEMLPATHAKAFSSLLQLVHSALFSLKPFSAEHSSLWVADYLH
ncbi:unnamed protein product [Trypanosoma congolense IL3000]|uniref:WGS project CAEQ00000000 data, annotated contig 519 n=1 Tax=Trypanosoma congolense (strain IL3000) TaxID=1068625 RepID=F9WGN1_TRYCI|nr:unnamed protein product [Trypanosoma congolense IL3000]